MTATEELKGIIAEFKEEEGKFNDPNPTYDPRVEYLANTIQWMQGQSDKVLETNKSLVKRLEQSATITRYNKRSYETADPDSAPYKAFKTDDASRKFFVYANDVDSNKAGMIRFSIDGMHGSQVIVFLLDVSSTDTLDQSVKQIEFTDEKQKVRGYVFWDTKGATAVTEYIL